MPRTVGLSTFSHFVATDPFLLPEPLSSAGSASREPQGCAVIAFRLPDQEVRTVAETPTYGRGAVTRWLDLHDAAVRLRAGVKPGDTYADKHARRAIASLFRYEHQLTSETRRKAREALWQRDRDEPFPALDERQHAWKRCRCPLCMQVYTSESGTVPQVVIGWEGVA